MISDSRQRDQRAALAAFCSGESFPTPGRHRLDPTTRPSTSPAGNGRLPQLPRRTPNAAPAVVDKRLRTTKKGRSSASDGLDRRHQQTGASHSQAVGASIAVQHDPESPLLLPANSTAARIERAVVSQLVAMHELWGRLRVPAPHRAALLTRFGLVRMIDALHHAGTLPAHHPTEDCTGLGRATVTAVGSAFAFPAPAAMVAVRGEVARLTRQDAICRHISGAIARREEALKALATAVIAAAAHPPALARAAAGSGSRSGRMPGRGNGITRSAPSVSRSHIAVFPAGSVSAVGESASTHLTTETRSDGNLTAGHPDARGSRRGSAVGSPTVSADTVRVMEAVWRALAAVAVRTRAVVSLLVAWDALAAPGHALLWHGVPYLYKVAHDVDLLVPLEWLRSGAPFDLRAPSLRPRRPHGVPALRVALPVGSSGTASAQGMPAPASGVSASFLSTGISSPSSSFDPADGASRRCRADGTSAAIDGDPDSESVGSPASSPMRSGGSGPVPEVSQENTCVGAAAGAGSAGARNVRAAYRGGGSATAGGARFLPHVPKVVPSSKARLRGRASRSEATHRTARDGGRAGTPPPPTAGSPAHDALVPIIIPPPKASPESLGGVNTPLEDSSLPLVPDLTDSMVDTAVRAAVARAAALAASIVAEYDNAVLESIPQPIRSWAAMRPTVLSSFGPSRTQHSTSTGHVSNSEAEATTSVPAAVRPTIRTSPSPCESFFAARERFPKVRRWSLRSAMALVSTLTSKDDLGDAADTLYTASALRAVFPNTSVRQWRAAAALPVWPSLRHRDRGMGTRARFAPFMSPDHAIAASFPSVRRRLDALRRRAALWSRSRRAAPMTYRLTRPPAELLDMLGAPPKDSSDERATLCPNQIWTVPTAVALRAVSFARRHPAVAMANEPSTSHSSPMPMRYLRPGSVTASHHVSSSAYSSSPVTWRVWGPPSAAAVVVAVRLSLRVAAWVRQGFLAPEGACAGPDTATETPPEVDASKNPQHGTDEAGSISHNAAEEPPNDSEPSDDTPVETEADEARPASCELQSTDLETTNAMGPDSLEHSHSVDPLSRSTNTEDQPDISNPLHVAPRSRRGPMPVGSARLLREAAERLMRTGIDWDGGVLPSGQLPISLMSPNPGTGVGPTVRIGLAVPFAAPCRGRALHSAPTDVSLDSFVGAVVRLSVPFPVAPRPVAASIQLLQNIWRLRVRRQRAAARTSALAIEEQVVFAQALVRGYLTRRALGRPISQTVVA
eukprot:TRINITY_DN33307_c0_g1_i1.p1 TRINITY_DN33307_c0_g1~~TRINITY_DN33307_c0_g1_i1.p1  ORF type:complete len:1250 (-),score=107.73 TRINITY_DN33307_c0_g1_i1:778-4527(-)